MLIEGRSWHPFINLLKIKEAEMKFFYAMCWGLTNKPNSERQKSVQLTEFEYGGTHGQSWTTHA